jgi:hypothetical protein
VLVDDDSLVRTARLLAVLGAIRRPRARRLYIGDVSSGLAMAHAAKFTQVPFACGGAGSVLSRAAVLAIDFAACARQWVNGCYQSDWMIARCAYDAGVQRIGDTPRAGEASVVLSDGSSSSSSNSIDGSGPIACGTCQLPPPCALPPPCRKRPRSVACALAHEAVTNGTDAALTRLRRGCAFAQYSVRGEACPADAHDPNGVRAALVCRVASRAAISHARCAGAPQLEPRYRPMWWAPDAHTNRSHTLETLRHAEVSAWWRRREGGS